MKNTKLSGYMPSQKNSLIYRILSLLPSASFGIFVSIILFLAIGSKIEQQRYNTLKTNMRAVAVTLELERPGLKQETIDLAMAIFSIDIAKYVKGPTFDSNLLDRGLTSGRTIDVEKTITIGIPAFASWAVLGSTLGHEIEVHSQQSFASIMILDGIYKMKQNFSAMFNGKAAQAQNPSNNSQDDDYGTWKAERTAYEYEISSANRFGLNQQEVASINQVMAYFYPQR